MVPVIANNDLHAEAQAKRFIDLWRLDGSFREEIRRNPDRGVRAWGLVVDPGLMRPVWSPDDPGEHSPVLRACLERISRQASQRRSLRALGEPANASMAAWRRRQIARCESELGPEQHREIVHAPVVFELSEGCSVGCWFCGIGAQKPARHAVYTERGAWWRDILDSVRRVIGEAASAGFCYWATEPLDNPDYFSFAEDFALRLGRFPQTTTAIPLADPTRTRELLRRSQSHSSYVRFSMRTDGEVRRLMEEFSPEELIDVVLLPLNSSSGSIKILAGNARAARSAPGGHRLTPPDNSSTIACVSGFLVNLVTRTVRLITPCNADDARPLGYVTLARREFKDADGLHAGLQDMIRECMQGVNSRAIVRFRPDLVYDSTSRSLASRWMVHRYPPLETMAGLAEMIEEGTSTAAEIAVRLEESGVPQASTLVTLQALAGAGLLDEAGLVADPPPAEERSRELLVYLHGG